MIDVKHCWAQDVMDRDEHVPEDVEEVREMLAAMPLGTFHKTWRHVILDALGCGFVTLRELNVLMEVVEQRTRPADDLCECCAAAKRAPNRRKCMKCNEQRSRMYKMRWELKGVQ